MKKKLIGVAMAGLLAASAIGLAACGSSKGENELWITYYKGGYGEEWVQQLARKFEEEHEGVKVVTKPDTLLIDNVPNMMQNGTKYDLIFCHDVAWEDFVQPGWIEELDDLFETQVSGTSSDGTFAGRIWDEDVLESCTYIKNGQPHYYKVPWTIGTAGIAYNVTVMDRIDGWLAKQGETRRWNQTPPQTYYELLQYCEDVIAANLRSVEGDRNAPVIKPFTWSGKSEEYQWDYVVFDWWGQLAGPETMNVFKNFNNVTADGKIDWTKTNDPDVNVYNPEQLAKDNNGVGWKEFQQAYTLWYDLVVGQGHDAWSTNESKSNSKFQNEQAFANGEAAMAPAACWIENESKAYLNKSGQVISLMPTPTIENVKLNSNDEVLAKDATTGVAYTLDAIHGEAGAPKTLTTKDGNTYNRVSFTSSFGDSVMIPAKSSQKALAKQFILFMQEEENAQLFTRTSGGTVLPYKYDYSNSFSAAGETASKWQASIFEINQNSTKFNNYTKHPMMRDTELKAEARMTSVWPENQYYYTKAFTSPTNGDYKPSKLISDIFKKESGKWNNYKNSYIRK